MKVCLSALGVKYADRQICMPSPVCIHCIHFVEKNTQKSMFFKVSFFTFVLLFVSCAGCDPYHNACNPQLFQ